MQEWAINVCKYLEIRPCRYPLVQMSDTQLNLYILTRAGYLTVLVLHFLFGRSKNSCTISWLTGADEK